MRGRGPLIASAAGAVWGLAGYALLWGSTPIVVHRPFVVSAVGTIVLLPVRAVLAAIHFLEGRAGRPFELSTSHGWIGLAAAATGAAIVLLAYVLVGAAARRLR